MRKKPNIFRVIVGWERIDSSLRRADGNGSVRYRVEPKVELDVWDGVAMG